MSDDVPRYRQRERDDDPNAGVVRSSDAGSISEPPRTGRDIWRASASFGFLIGVGLLLLALLGLIHAVVRVMSASGGQRVAWLAIVLALTALVTGIAFLLRALPTLRYRLSDDAFIVEWLGPRRIVPLSEITQIIFEPTESLRLPRWEPFWPGYYVATVRTPAGVWHSWATQQPHRRVRLVTQAGIIAISPERPIRFVSELDRRRQAIGQPSIAVSAVDQTALPSPSPEQPVRDATYATRPPSVARPRSRQPRAAQNPIVATLIAYWNQFRDRLLSDHLASILVAVGVILPVLMAAYLYSQYEGLPDQIPIHWDASGDIAEQTAPNGLWRFPRIAVVVLIVNTAIATLLIGIDRYLARMLVAAIPLVQLILFIALIRAVN